MKTKNLTFFALIISLLTLFSACEPAEKPGKEILGTPVLTSEIINKNSISVKWDAVENAISYLYDVDGEQNETAKTSILIENLEIPSTHIIRVKAVADEKSNFTDSEWAEITVEIKNVLPTPELTYETSGKSFTIKWNAIEGASSYKYQSDNGEEAETSETKVVFNDQATPGIYTVKVKAIAKSDYNATDSDWAEIDVMLSENTEEINPEFAYIASNCPSTVPESGLGVQGGQMTKFTAITKISADKLAEGGSKVISGMRLGITDKSSDCKAFIRESKDGSNLAEASFEYNPNGWSIAEFDTPYTIPADKDLYFGYEISSAGYALGTCGSGSAKDDEIAIDGQWTKLSSVTRGYLGIQAILNGGNYGNIEPRYDLSIAISAQGYVNAGSNNEIFAFITNDGVVMAKDIKVSGTVGDQSINKDIKDFNLMPGKYAKISLGSFTAPEEPTNITIKATVENTDHKDATTSNNTATARQIVNVGGYERNMVLIEQFTGQACPNCPAGGESLKNAIAAMDNPNKVCWIAHHSGYYPDDFTLNEDKEIANAFGVNAAPMSIVNRSPFQFDKFTMVGHPGYITTSALNELTTIESAASINIDHTYNTETRELSVTVSGDTKIDEIKLTVLVMQSGLKASQAGASGQYMHNYVPRIYMTEALGDKLDVSSGKYTKTITTTLPEMVGKYNMVDKDIEIVAFITYDKSLASESFAINATKVSLVENANKINLKSSTKRDRELNYAVPMAL